MYNYIHKCYTLLIFNFLNYSIYKHKIFYYDYKKEYKRQENEDVEIRVKKLKAGKA